MLTYSYADAQAHFPDLLKKAKELREVMIQGDDGLCFVIKLLPQKKANYNLPTLNLDLSREEIVECVRETRIR